MKANSERPVAPTLYHVSLTPAFNATAGSPSRVTAQALPATAAFKTYVLFARPANPNVAASDAPAGSETPSATSSTSGSTAVTVT